MSGKGKRFSAVAETVDAAVTGVTMRPFEALMSSNSSSQKSRMPTWTSFWTGSRCATPAA